VSEEAHRLLRLELVAPSGPVFDDNVLQVVLPGTGGAMGILPKHAPLVAQLYAGAEERRGVA
jgi:F0F1-type ATP synthase epsilon subunit